MIDGGERWLRLPDDYARHLGGLRWSATGDAIEDAARGTFAVGPEIGLFVEGLCSDGSEPLHLAHVLHLLRIFGRGVDRGVSISEAAPPFGSLRIAFARAGRPVRHAGVLARILCAGVPRVPQLVDLVEVRRKLASPVAMGALLAQWSLAPSAADQPSLGPSAFEEAVARSLALFDQEGLRAWLERGHGTVPVRATAPLVQALERARPPTLEGLLGAVARRDRLAGAIPHVARLVSALALPPRRDRPAELPVGGFSDLATRGNLEQLLPSQLALDPIEFVRRFAENELLFYRREDPKQHREEELHVLVDQGVRTWGPPRLALGAAALALGRLAAKRGIALRLATTGAPALVDPLEVGEEVVGRLLEGSDLTPEPSLALEKVLAPSPALPRSAGEGAKDVVLLTHPRNLAEPSVMAAAARAPAGVRIFAVTIDETGAGALAELRGGRPVEVVRVRLDLSGRAEAPPKDAIAKRDPGAWTGDVEPFGFPFRFGIAGRKGRHYDWAGDGEWLVVESQNGLLHAFHLDGIQSEVLPRGCRARYSVVSEAKHLVGVSGGVVVAGYAGIVPVLVHYDFGRRHVRVHVLDTGHEAWFYDREHHCVIGRTGEKSEAIDLATGERARGEGGDPHGRAAAAWRAWRDRTRREGEPDLVSERGQSIRDASDRLVERPRVRLAEGELTVYDGERKHVLRPLADNKPSLAGAHVRSAQYHGDVLVLAVELASGSSVVQVYSLAKGVLTAEWPLVQGGSIVLSPDGGAIAHDAPMGRVAVRRLAAVSVPAFVTPAGKFHDRLDVTLGETWLAVRVGTRAHVISWAGVELEVSFGTRVILAENGVRATSTGLPPATYYDQRRFIAAACHSLAAVVDCYGHVILLEVASGKHVATFFVYRGQVAGWLPDGARLGPASLTGVSPTLGAREKFATALRSAMSRSYAGDFR